MAEQPPTYVKRLAPFAVAALALVAACVADDVTGDGGADTGLVDREDPNEAEDAGADPPTERRSQFRIFPGDGIFEVGNDIRPGTYRTREGSPGCYWARLRNFRGELNSIKANDNTDGPAVVTIAKNDKGFESTRCATWTSDVTRITQSRTRFGEGTYIVGVDIRPGTYRNSGGDGCYWERLSNFKHEGVGGIIANDNTDGPTIVQIRSSDKGFTSVRCGTWRRR